MVWLVRWRGVVWDRFLFCWDLVRVCGRDAGGWTGQFWRLRCFSSYEKHGVIHEGQFEFVEVMWWFDEVCIVEVVKDGKVGITLVKSIGDFERFGSVVIECEYSFSSCHASHGPFCVLSWDLAVALVVYNTCSDGVGECAWDIKEEARYYKAFWPFFKCPVDGQHKWVSGGSTRSSSKWLEGRRLWVSARWMRFFRYDGGWYFGYCVEQGDQVICFWEWVVRFVRFV